MSRDRTHYTLECQACFTLDQLTIWIDDWGRWGIEGMNKFTGRIYIVNLRSETLTCDQCGATTPKIKPCSPEAATTNVSAE